MIVRLSPRAERDLRRLDPPVRRRVVEGLRALGGGAPNLDLKALKGASPWWRLRLNDHRILYRPLDEGWLVKGIVDQRDLERAVRSLD